jgi:hypothetical protein
MSQLTSGEVVERANQADRVLKDPTLQKAFEGVRQNMLATLEATAIGDRDTQHEIALSLQVLKSVKRQLERWVNDGEVEKRRNA